MIINKPTRIKKVEDCKYDFRQLHAVMLLDGDDFAIQFDDCDLVIRIKRGQFTYNDFIGQEMTKQQAEYNYKHPKN